MKRGSGRAQSDWGNLCGEGVRCVNKGRVFGHGIEKNKEIIYTCETTRRQVGARGVIRVGVDIA